MTTRISVHGRAHHQQQVDAGLSFHAHTHCPDCGGHHNERGDDNDARQIRADLISDNRSPFTAAHYDVLATMDAKTLRQLRDTYLGAPDGGHTNVAIRVNAGDPEVAAMTLPSSLRVMQEQRGLPVTPERAPSRLPAFLQPTPEDIAHWGSELEAATQLTALWCSGIHPSKLRANRGAAATQQDREEVEAMSLTSLDVIREQQAKKAPLVRVAKE